MLLPIPHRPGAAPPHSRPLPGGAGLALATARVHEICGAARRTLASLIAAEERRPFPVLWVLPGWQAERPFAAGLRAFLDPARLILATARRPEDILWSAEEALRSGAVPLVVAELPAPPALTPVRRLHLAAGAGAEVAAHRGNPAPLGLILTPEGAAPGVESRWSLAPAPSGSALIEGGTAWHLHRLRARMDPPAAWHLRRDASGRCTAERLGAE